MAASTTMLDVSRGRGDADPRVDPVLLDTYVTTSRMDRLIHRMDRKGVAIISIIAVVTPVAGIVVLCTALGVGKSSSFASAGGNQSSVAANNSATGSDSSDATSNGSNKQSNTSSGPTNVNIPARLLDCSSYPDAARYLRNLGMTNASVVEQYSGIVKTGCTVSSSVRPGMDVPADINERIVVSRGSQPVAVPNVAGMNAAQALAELRKLGLNATTKSSPVGEAFPRVLS
ncbi:MAG: PASTA domain-containing protein [Aeriscardovia sp.]|nr:PASTA domain-containing protein [Aeriscardovia sp.]